MPIYSKEKTSKGNGIKGISRHKIRVASSIDENDNLLLEIADLSRCTTDMLRDILCQKLDNEEYINQS